MGRKGQKGGGGKGGREGGREEGRGRDGLFKKLMYKP